MTDQSHLQQWLPLILAGCTLIGGIAAAMITAFSKKFRTPADDREDTKLVIESQTQLIATVRGMLTESENKHKGDLKALAEKVETLEGKVSALEKVRDRFVLAVRSLVIICRKYGGDEAMAEVEKVDIPTEASVH